MHVSPRVYEMISCIWADISSYEKPMSSPTRFSSGWKISPPYRDFILSILVQLALIVGSAVATMRTAPRTPTLPAHMEHPPAGAVMSDPAGASKSETGIVASSAAKRSEARSSFVAPARRQVGSEVATHATSIREITAGQAARMQSPLDLDRRVSARVGRNRWRRAHRSRDSLLAAWTKNRAIRPPLRALLPSPQRSLGRSAARRRGRHRRFAALDRCSARARAGWRHRLVGGRAHHSARRPGPRRNRAASLKHSSATNPSPSRSRRRSGCTSRSRTTTFRRRRAHTGFSRGALPPTYAPINAWVAGATEGKITDLLQGSPDPLVRAVLVNAVYFKGSWAAKFDPAHTRPGTFHAAGASIPAQFMHRSAKQLPASAAPSDARRRGGGAPRLRARGRAVRGAPRAARRRRGREHGGGGGGPPRRGQGRARGADAAAHGQPRAAALQGRVGRPLPRAGAQGARRRPPLQRLGRLPRHVRRPRCCTSATWSTRRSSR